MTARERAMPPILAAGDHFVLPELHVDAIRAEVGDDTEIRTLQAPWPEVPFGRVAEVDEASGTEDELIEALAGVRVCVAHVPPFTRRVFEAAPDHKLIAVGRGGPVNINVEAATEHGVTVCYSPGRNAVAVAEFAVAMMIAASRRMASTAAMLAHGEWKGDAYRYDQCGPELRGSVVGIIGTGAVGTRVARILTAFGADVLAHDPYVDPSVLEGLARYVELDELLARSSIVSLHARISETSRGMIGPAQLAAMPAGSVLVNTARGPLLDYDALCDALDSGHLAAAGLDVYDVEPPPPGSRLLRTPNLMLTPHIAGASRPTAANAASLPAGEAGRYLRGEPLKWCVNPETLKARG
jgi:D-3-phosphoglycerate dehydrogenase